MTSASGGTATYTIMKDGTITAFALNYDRDNDGSVTYSNLVINETPIEF